jgi:hypothetical protein
MTIVSPLLVGSTANRPASNIDRPRRLVDDRIDRVDVPRLQDQVWSSTTEREVAHPSMPGLPLAVSLTMPKRAALAYYAITTMEVDGRLGDRSPQRTLNWQPGLRIDMAPMAGVVVIRPDLNGTGAIGPQGYLRLPARVRRVCQLATGDRLLVAARTDAGVLLIYTMANLDTMILTSATVRQGLE